MTIRERGVVRSIMGFVLVAILVLTSACSTIRLGYGQAPTLLYHWLDGWVDFDDAQQAKVREALDAMLVWHRRTQLPDYARWLSKTAAEAPRDNLTADEMCRTGKDLEARWFALIDHLMPAAADLAASLSDAQIARIQKRFDEGLERYREEFAIPDAKEREKKALERAISRSENFYGSLDDAQKAVLAASVKTPGYDPEAVITERRHRVRELVEIVREGRRAVQEGLSAAPGRSEAAEAPPRGAASASERGGPREAALAKLRVALREWTAHGVQSPRAEYRALQTRMQQASCALSAKVHNAGGASVRQAAREKLESWAADAKVLAAAAEAQ